MTKKEIDSGIKEDQTKYKEKTESSKIANRYKQLLFS
jgi:hypothetical protein